MRLRELVHRLSIRGAVPVKARGGLRGSLPVGPYFVDGLKPNARLPGSGDRQDPKWYFHL